MSALPVREAVVAPTAVRGRLASARVAAAGLVGMIQDVDESLRALVRRDALRGSDVEVAFDAPTRDWAARRNAPVVDLYLYDIREDQHRREVVWQRVHDESGVVLRREPPPRRLRLSYLITAWTQRPEDEHRLLSALLSCFLSHDIVPPDLVTGSFLGSRIPVHLHVAQPPPQDRSLSDVWSALGGELKPSLDLVVVAPFTVMRAEEAGPPVREVPRLSLADATEDGEDGEEAAGARAGGRGRRGRATAGEAGAEPTPAEKAAGDTGRTPLEAAAESTAYVPGTLPGEVAQDVAIQPGGKGRPGRIVRVRGVRRP
jgi:hypothetical protein